MPAPSETDALILVDLQNDFLPAGALPVPQGDQVIPIANRVQQCFDLVVATQDWHPRNHASFAANHRDKEPGEVIELSGLKQVLWPVHCVQHTDGAEFASGLDTRNVRKVFRKGTDPEIDSYSGFFDNGHRKATGLGEYIERGAIKTVYILGLATDYCVKFTALDALELDFNVFLVQDGCRGVNLNPGDVEAAFREMSQAGVRIIQSNEILLSAT